MGFWKDSDEISDYEMLQDEIEESQYVANQIADSISEEMDYNNSSAVVEADEEQLEEIAEEAAYDLDKKESNVIYNARLRLEQAKLYEMLINHSLFAGVDASSDAIKIVEDELKHFIIRRLEILLGIRKPVKKTEVPEHAEIKSSPFNDVEVNFLKQLAYKGTLGKSIVEAPQQPKLNTLVGSTKPQHKPVESKKVEVARPHVEKGPITPPVRQQAVRKKTPAKNIQTPVAKNNTKPTKISSGGAIKRALTNEEALQLAKEDLEKMKGRKSIHELKGKEKQKLIQEVNKRHKKKVKNGGEYFPQENELIAQYSRQVKDPADIINGLAGSLLKEGMKIKNK